MWFFRSLEWLTDTFGWLSQASSRYIIIIITMNIKSENHDHRPNNPIIILIANIKLRSWALWSLRAALASLSVSLPWASETLGERNWAYSIVFCTKMKHNWEPQSDAIFFSRKCKTASRLLRKSCHVGKKHPLYSGLSQVPDPSVSLGFWPPDCLCHHSPLPQGNFSHDNLYHWWQPQPPRCH